MSSPTRLGRGLLFACMLAIAAGGGGACGGDDEGMQVASESPPADESPTVSADESTAPSTTAPDESARRKQRRGEGDRKRRRREKDSSATETKRESPPDTTAEAPPPEPEPEPQPAPGRSEPPAEDEPRVLRIVENATLKLVKREGITYWQEGRVRGTLSGKIAVKVTIGGPGVISTFTVTLPNGTIRGRGKASVKPDGSVVHYKGTASITGGTGKYADASGRNLGYTGTGASDASTATARLTGKLRY